MTRMKPWIHQASTPDRPVLNKLLQGDFIFDIYFEVSNVVESLIQ